MYTPILNLHLFLVLYLTSKSIATNPMPFAKVLLVPRFVNAPLVCRRANDVTYSHWWQLLPINKWDR